MPMFLRGGNRGWVRRVQAPSGSPGVIVTGLTLANCLITRAAASDSCSFQVQHMLGDKIYVYSFGDRVGDIGIAGLAYFDCRGGGRHGIGSVVDWYKKNKFSKTGRKGSITIAQRNMQGYLVGMRLDSPRTEEGLLEFYLSFIRIPDKR